MNRIHPATAVAAAWIIMIAILLIADASSTASARSTASAEPVYGSGGQPAADALVNRAVPVVEPIFITPTPAPAARQDDPALVVAPYKKYILTQGPHGFSYGHAAIDLTAGQGAVIHSPINGTVTQLFTDEIGNPTLVIENDLYQVLLMHGDYTVSVGEQLSAGQPVGYESNNGNTVDWRGVSCRGRSCGYHTHLNIFDKTSGSNIDPLLLIPLSQ